MKLAALLVAVSSPALATTFDEYSDKVHQQPAYQLYEASCDISIELAGAVATIDVRQRIANPGPDAMAALFEMPVPAHAQITRFATRGDRGIAVDVQSPSTEGATPVLGVDPAILTRDGDEYRIVVQPIAENHDEILETTLTTLAEVRGGFLRLTLPGRDAMGKLTACKGTIRATPGPGATVKRIRVGSTETQGARATFALEKKDVTIDVELDVAGTQPVVWTQTQPLADGWNATLVTALGPRVKAAGARRVVFVVDGSRSMDLVGRQNVTKAVNAIASALPKDAEIEGVIYDRKVETVFGEARPATPQNIAALETAISKRVATNGSDIIAAFKKTHDSIANARGQSMVVVLTDGVTGDVDANQLIDALGAKTSTVDVHAIVLDPATTQAPAADALRGPVNLLGGAYVEVAVDDLDNALVAIDEWLRPSWLEVAAAKHVVPKEIRAGGGFTFTTIHKGAANFTLTGHGETKFTSVARTVPPAAGLGAMILAEAGATEFTTLENPDDNDLETARPTLEKARVAHPVAGAEFSFAVLTSVGKVAKSRKQMVAGGGKYERVIALGDPTNGRNSSGNNATNPRTASAISTTTLERMFRDQLQPKAFACYQRALGKNEKLAGTVTFAFRMGRGEVTDVQLSGLGDAQFDACLINAGYELVPPLPDFTINADDQTIANYPLTFTRRPGQEATIVLGDADSSSPLDIDAIQGGVPSRKPTKADTSTPLGRMRPGK